MSVDLLTYLHDAVGLEWWVAIVSATVVARTLLMLPMVIQQR